MILSAHAKRLLLAAMLSVVLAGVGHLHSHVCFDDEHAGVTVHFENFRHHPHHASDSHAIIDDHDHDHGAAAVHQDDVENELTSPGLPGKAPDEDAPLFLLSLALLLCLRAPERRSPTAEQVECFHPPPATLLPLPRAPPVHS